MSVKDAFTKQNNLIIKTNAKYAAIIRKQEDTINDYKHLLYLYKLEITSLKADLENKESEIVRFEELVKQGIDKSVVALKGLSDNLNDLLQILNQKTRKSDLIITKSVKKSSKAKYAQKPSELIYVISEGQEPASSPELQKLCDSYQNDEIKLPSPPDSIGDEVMDVISRVRTRQNISYVLPNLKSKLRKGDKFTISQ